MRKQSFWSFSYFLLSWEMSDPPHRKPPDPPNVQTNGTNQNRNAKAPHFSSNFASHIQDICGWKWRISETLHHSQNVLAVSWHTLQVYALRWIYVSLLLLWAVSKRGLTTRTEMHLWCAVSWPDLLLYFSLSFFLFVPLPFPSFSLLNPASFNFLPPLLFQTYQSHVTCHLRCFNFINSCRSHFWSLLPSSCLVGEFFCMGLYTQKVYFLSNLRAEMMFFTLCFAALLLPQTQMAPRLCVHLSRFP